MKNYISKSGEDAIKNFKYKGGSDSYSYNYIWSPLAEFVLKYFIPRSIAPNLITFIGFFILIITWFNIARQTPITALLQPNSILIMSIAFFIYQTLDNVDGKQARRIGASSPLGMLFDHGTDALVSLFLSFGFGRVVFLKDELTLILTCFLTIQLGFYFSVWGQYNSKGIMKLGRINAVDDGIPLTWMIGLTTYCVGQQWWLRESWFQFTYNQLLIIFISISSLFQVVSLIKRSWNQFQENILSAISQLLHIVLRLTSFMVIVYYTDWYLQGRYFYHMYFSLCLPFIRDITYLQICVVTQQKYQQFSNPTIVYILSFPTYIFLTQYLGFTKAYEPYFIHITTIYFVLEYLHFVLAIIWQISSVLNIKVFSVSYLKDKQSKNNQGQKSKEAKVQ